MAKTEKLEAAKIRVLVFDGGRPYDEPEFAEMLTALGDEFEFSRATLPQDRALLRPGLEKRFDALLFYDMRQTPTSNEEFARYETLLKSGKIGVFFLRHRLSGARKAPISGKSPAELTFSSKIARSKGSAARSALTNTTAKST
ncbi:MAG: hypothetical protein J6K20_11220 [Thermoguttaceae bacterium]|nr:hypothetical protein [Thermoguttaceae bacterium]